MYGSHPELHTTRLTLPALENIGKEKHERWNSKKSEDELGVE
jgi:hypothetical protein